MEKARTLVVTLTAWLSFLAALWLYSFKLVPWQIPLLMFGVMAFVFGLAAAPKK